MFFLLRKFRSNKKVKHLKKNNFSRLIKIVMKCEKIIKY